MRDYEMVFIARPGLDDEALQSLIERLQEAIGQYGQVTETDVWGKRSLAYPIAKEREGIYFLFRAQMNPESVPALDQSIRYMDDVIRHLIIRTPE